MTTATKKSKLPTDSRPLPLDPDLASALEMILAPYSGKKLEAAQAAIIKVRHSGVVGSFDALVRGYRDGILKAVGEA